MPPSAPRRQGGGLCRPGPPPTPPPVPPPPASAAARRESFSPRAPTRRDRGRAPRPAPAAPEPCAPRAAPAGFARHRGRRHRTAALGPSFSSSSSWRGRLRRVTPRGSSLIFVFSVSCRYRALSRLARAEAAIYRHRGEAKEGMGRGERRASPAAPRLQRLLRLPAVTAAPRGSGRGRGREAGATRGRGRLFSGVSHAAAPGEVAEAAAAAGAPVGARAGLRRGRGGCRAAQPPSRRTSRDYTHVSVLPT